MVLHNLRILQRTQGEVKLKSGGIPEVTIRLRKDTEGNYLATLMDSRDTSKTDYPSESNKLAVIGRCTFAESSLTSVHVTVKCSKDKRFITTKNTPAS